MVTDIWRYSFGERAVWLAAALAVALALGASAKPVFAADGTIAIDLTYDSTMDMSKPEVHPNISVHHNLQVRLSGGKLTENRDRSTGRFFDKNATVQEHGSADAGNVSWHVIDQASGPDPKLFAERSENDGDREHRQYLPPRCHGRAKAWLSGICLFESFGA